MRLALGLVLISVCFTACSRPPELQLVRRAADAMGGLSRVESVRTLVLEGEGLSPNLGQNVTPDAPLPVWKITGYKRAIDLVNFRMREQLVRTARFLFALPGVQRQDQGLDGDVAYNVDPDGTPRRASESAARDRRFETLHHPLALVRAGLSSGARLANLRRQNNLDLVDITTARGDRLTLAVDRATGLPSRITSLADNPNLGDVFVQTAFSDWEAVSGLRLPRRLTTHIDKYPGFDLQVTRNSLDAGAPDLAAPAAARQEAPPLPPPVTVTAEEVADGIWWLAGSGNHRSVVFEFADHLTLFEVPLNDARSAAVIATARALRPNKPLTQAIVSHHHFDHSGGLRVAVAEGLTIITWRGNVEFFKDLVARRHTIVPDALAKGPQSLKITPVDDQLTLRDSSLEVTLYHLKDNPREGTNLFAWVPRDGILVQADLYDSTWTQYPWADNVLQNLKMRKLAVRKDVPVHGEIQAWDEVLQTMESKLAGAN